MTKPIGYYTSYTPGDEGLLAEMQEAWGAQLQSLTNFERTWLISQIADNLCADFSSKDGDDSARSGVLDVAARIQLDELTVGDQLRLIETLTSQVISS